jgi:nucleotide-binding universal stress UspA family protein
METLNRIIVGHDLRAGGSKALESAAVLAQGCGAGLRVVHVVEPLHAYQRLSHPLTSPYSADEIAEKAGARLKVLVSDAPLARLQAEYEVRIGKPFVELIIAQRAWLANLIVIGTTAEPEEPFLGSTAERLVRKAPVPVMVAKKRLAPEPKTLLLPTDFSACARKAAQAALALAKGFDARVIFLHILEPYPEHTIAYVHELGVSLPIPPPTPEQIEPEWEAFLSDLPLEKIRWEKHVGEGPVASAIVRQVQHTGADMIVIGTHGRSGLPHMLLGSIAEKVVRTASCPVLTVRPEAFRFELP